MQELIRVVHDFAFSATIMNKTSYWPVTLARTPAGISTSHFIESRAGCGRNHCPENGACPCAHITGIQGR